MKILIAEDSPTTRELLAWRLTADGYQVIQAADGEEALRLACLEVPDLLVLDNVMPKLDGFQVLTALRADSRTRTTPVIMLTLHNDDPALADSLGVAEYMPKPFSPHELSTRVRRIIGEPGQPG